MSDVSDVSSVLVGLIAAAVYPNGTGAASITNKAVKVYAGWPQSETLTSDLASGITHVTVFPQQSERKTTRYYENQVVLSNPTPTITLAISGQTVTLGGEVSTPQNVMLSVNGQDFVYAVQSGNTLTNVATGLTSLLVTGGIAATSVGAVITVPALSIVRAARAGAFGSVAAEYKRQERVWQISVWAGTPALRDTVSSIVDLALAKNHFLTMTDGFAARIIYKNSPQFDGMQKSYLYRRDLNYSVEFATTETSLLAQVIATQTGITQGNTTITVMQ